MSMEYTDVPENLRALHLKRDFYERKMHEIINEINAIEDGYEYVKIKFIDSYNWEDIVTSICENHLDPKSGYYIHESYYNKIKNLLTQTV